jgi:FKBP-type peptidyl-prolyl cis-trans isomerase SlyD
MTGKTGSDSAGLAEGFRVGPGMHVQLDYRVHDAEGEAVGPELERLEVIFGMGQLLPVVEQTIDGLGVGQSKRLKLLARDAYGQRNPDAVLEIERGEFPPDVAEGDYFEVENPDEGLLVLRILEVAEEFVVVDLNHPFAGQDLDVEVTILQVRPATQQELELALQVGASDEPDEQLPLISPDSLLRGHGRR